MWAPRWLRTLARRKSGEKANAESARQLNDYFAPGGGVSTWEDGSDTVPAPLHPGEHIIPGAGRIKGRLLGDAYVRYEPDATRFRQDLRPIPSWSPRHTYGGKGTIHNTTTIDVQLDEQTGEVVAVWFRCLNLPFTVSTVDHQPVNNPAEKAIEEITYVELPSEEGSQ
jgi:hypothetical protein